MSKQEKANLSDILEWLIFNGYYKAASDIHNVQFKENPSELEVLTDEANKRIPFIDVNLLIDSFDYSDKKKFENLLKRIEVLETKFGSEVREKGTTHFEWYFEKRKIVQQMAICILNDHLCREESGCPDSVEEITLPASFNYKSYKSDITKLLESRKSSMINADFKTDIESFTVNLMDGRSKTTNLILRKVFFLFKDNDLNEFIDDMALFVKDIEKKLLPEPEIIFRYKPENSFSQSSQTNSDNVMEMDWSEEQKESHGPYADDSKNKRSARKSQETPAMNNYDNKKTPSLKSKSDNNSSKKVHSESEHVVTNLRSSKNVLQKKYNDMDPVKYLANNQDYDQTEDNDNNNNNYYSNNNNKQEQVSKGAINKKRKASLLVNAAKSGDKIPTIDEDEIEEFEEEEKESAINKLASMKLMKVSSSSKFPPQLDPHLAAAAQPPKTHHTKRPWSADEENALLQALSVYGEGQWARILEDDRFKDKFKGRTNVNLKDKYRNLIKIGKVVQFDNDDEGEEEEDEEEI